MSAAEPGTGEGAVTDVAKITVEPAVFTLINYDADEIAAVVRHVAERLGVVNPVHVSVDETTPLAKMSARLVSDDDARPSSESTISIRVESGALEDTQRLTNFSERNARLSLGRVLLRARDRLRPDFADVPDDLDLALGQNAAWDAYCAGRLERLGFAPHQQRFRYNFRNRFGFTDETDVAFDRVWAAENLAWSELPNAD